MKLRIHTHTSTVQPLKLGNGKIISSHSLLITDYLSMQALNLIHIDLLEMLYHRPIPWKCLWAHDINLIRMCHFNRKMMQQSSHEINTKIMFTRFDIWACKLFVKLILDTWNISGWRHQMGTFSALLAICAGNSPVTGEVPTQRPVTRKFEVFSDLRPNKRLRRQW